MKSMTFKEIISREESNEYSIWLYLEGLFMKAYERSAVFAHTLIHEFKLSKRYIKTVNTDVILRNFTDQQKKFVGKIAVSESPHS